MGMKRTSFFLLSFLFSALVFADSKPIQLEGKSLGKFPFRVLGAAKYQNATFSSKDGTIKSRHLNGFGAEAIGGLVVGPVIIGGGGEYMSWIQANDPGDDSDASGSSVNLFGSLGVSIHRFLLMGKYIFQSTYQVNKSDANGDKVKYFAPSGSYGAALIYRLGKRTFINLEYNSWTYGKSKAGGTTTGLGGSERLKLSSVGLSYGIMF
jgi:hypothetical protein